MNERGPVGAATAPTAAASLARARCPWCESTDTRLASLFGGTVSEILFECMQCRTPFGVMKWDTLTRVADSAATMQPGGVPDGR